MEKGYLHIYFGNGKGKTTAAIGLAFRAVGRGLRVGYTAFLKCKDCPELSENAPFTVFPPKRDFGFLHTLSPIEKEELKEESLSRLEEIFAHAEEFDLLILDELIDAVELSALPKERVLSLLKNRPSGMEVVLTGHSLPQDLSKIADYITEMTAIRHPYEKGISARCGIEY